MAWNSSEKCWRRVLLQNEFSGCVGSAASFGFMIVEPIGCSRVRIINANGLWVHLTFCSKKFLVLFALLLFY